MPTGQLRCEAILNLYGLLWVEAIVSNPPMVGIALLMIPSGTGRVVHHGRSLEALLPHIWQAFPGVGIAALAQHRGHEVFFLEPNRKFTFNCRVWNRRQAVGEAAVQHESLTDLIGTNRPAEAQHCTHRRFRRLTAV